MRRFTLFFALAFTLWAYSKTTVDLSGQWKCWLDSNDKGLAIDWTQREFADSAWLPGTTDSNGLGVPNTLAPALTRPQLSHLTRKHSYVGPAWYQRDIVIPKEMANKPLRISLERVLWQSRLWIDGIEVNNPQESLTTPHEFEIPEGLNEGMHTLTLRIDNRKLYDISVSDMGHAYTDETQIKWNGVLGKMTIAMIDPVEITNVIVTPNVRGNEIKVTAEIENHLNESAEANLTLRIDQEILKTASINIAPGSQRFDFTCPMPNDARAWNEFSPVCYQLNATLLTSQGQKSEANAQFGMREVSTDGNKLLVNGTPIFLRGTLESCIFPLTGTPPMTTDGWHKAFDTAKSWGLNHLRFHSWCPPEAAFSLADSLGIYLQIELPCWTLTLGEDTATVAWLKKEAQLISKAYGNHPSFLLMTCGNEMQPDFEILNNMVAEMQERDPRHLYAATSFTFEPGHGKHPEPNDQFFVTQYTDSGWVRGQGLFDVEPPRFDADYRQSVKHLQVPLIIHEVGQYAVYPNLDEIEKYQGTLLPLNFMGIRDCLDSLGMLDKASSWTQASGTLASILYKEEVERALRTDGVSGFQLLDLHDYPGQGTALVGLLDAFWDSKGIIEADQWRQHCSPIVPLALFPKAIYKSGESFEAEAKMANYSDKDLLGKALRWEIIDTKSASIIDKGAFTQTDFPRGQLTEAGNINVILPATQEPLRADVRLWIDDAECANSWPIWIFPNINEEEVINMTQGIVLTKDPNTALQALAEGKKVLLSPTKDKLKGLDGKFVPVFWSPVHFPDQAGTMGLICDPSHPALEAFPTESHSNWQWWSLVKNSTTIDMANVPEAEEIISQIDNFTNNRRLGSAFQARCGEGLLLMSAMDLWDEGQLADPSHPERTQLLVSFLRYMQSESFRPQGTIDTNQLLSIFRE